jgi:hypothetical protein
MQAVLLLLHRALLSSLREFTLVNSLRPQSVLQYYLSFAPLYQLDLTGTPHPATFCSASQPLASSGKHQQAMFDIGRRLPSVG